MNRIGDWWRGRWGDVTPDIGLCQCGHYCSVHKSGKCVGWARDQWLMLGPVRFLLRCRCRLFAEVVSED